MFVPRPRFESMRWRHKRKAPVAGGFQFQLVRRIGFRASAPRIRAGFARLPACSPARYGRSASASRSRLDRGSNPCLVSKKEKPPLPEASSSIGAAYRIRTYDVLIRSQTLYPAEVTPQRKTYKTTLAYWSQAQSQTFFGTQFCHAAPHIPSFPVRSIGFSITSNLASSSLRSDLTRWAQS